MTRLREGDRRHRIIVTLGELVAAVASVTSRDDEVVAAVAHLFRTGVCGNVVLSAAPGGRRRK